MVKKEYTNICSAGFVSQPLPWVGLQIRPNRLQIRPNRENFLINYCIV